jgi:hypothetical protein
MPPTFAEENFIKPKSSKSQKRQQTGPYFPIKKIIRWHFGMMYQSLKSANL